MSTQAINNPAFQQLQGFQPSRTPDDKLAAPSTSGSPAFVVTISSIQRSSASEQNRGFYEQRRAALDQLGAALQSGDSAAAQQAYKALVALGQTGPLRHGQTFRRTNRAQDFAAIGQALQSGNLAAAKTAFTALANSFNRRRPVADPLDLLPSHPLHRRPAMARLDLPRSSST